MTSLLVLDTHPLIWYAAGAEKKLGAAGRKAFREYERGEGAFYVPAPVVIETWFLSMNGTIAVEGSIAGWWQRIASPTLHHGTALPTTDPRPLRRYRPSKAARTALRSAPSTRNSAPVFAIARAAVSIVSRPRSAHAARANACW